MRVRIVMLLLSLLPTLLRADSRFESVLKEGKVWCYQWEIVANPIYDKIYRYTEISLKGDTLIDGITFRRVYQRQVSEEGASDEGWMPEDYWIGERDSEIYTYEIFTKECKLLLDFSMETGETFNKAGTQWSVTAVSDTILDSSTDRRVRRCLNVADTENTNRTDFWIEGIGSLSTGLVRSDDLEGAVPHLVSCMEGTVSLFVFQSISSGVASVPQLRTIDKSSSYDLQGRRLKGIPQRGMYIKDGKKKVVTDK